MQSLGCGQRVEYLQAATVCQGQGGAAVKAGALLLSCNSDPEQVAWTCQYGKLPAQLADHSALQPCLQGRLVFEAFIGSDWRVNMVAVLR